MVIATIDTGIMVTEIMVIDRMGIVVIIDIRDTRTGRATILPVTMDSVNTMLEITGLPMVTKIIMETVDIIDRIKSSMAIEAIIGITIITDMEGMRMLGSLDIRHAHTTETIRIPSRGIF